MKENLDMQTYMTASPHTINSGLPLKKAKELMKKYGVRHLPVQVAGHLVGVVTDRDLKLGASFDRAENLLVDDIMTPDPYAVQLNASLSDVVREMARKKFGCAVIQDRDGKVAGIFTATDGLRAFAALLGKKPAARKGKKK